jgi:uncharacterized protein YbjQ (UPF0145 family)
MNSSSTAEVISDVERKVVQAIGEKSKSLANDRAEALAALMDKAKSFKERGLIRPPTLSAANRQDFYELYLKR